MKHAKVWISVGVICVALIIVIGRAYERPAALPEPDMTTLAGPQETVPKPAYNPTTPLSKNKSIYINGMKIETTTEGTGQAITDGQTAVMSYTGKFENGTVFDASKNHGDGTFSFVLGAGQVIKGWDQGVLGMKVGESRTLTIPGDLAYGPMGIPGAIPPNATLIFDVTLLGIK